MAALMSPEPGQSARLSVFTSLRHSPDLGAGDIATGCGCLSPPIEECRGTVLAGDIRSAQGKREI